MLFIMNGMNMNYFEVCSVKKVFEMGYLLEALTKTAITPRFSEGFQAYLAEGFSHDL